MSRSGIRIGILLLLLAGAGGYYVYYTQTADAREIRKIAKARLHDADSIKDERQRIKAKVAALIGAKDFAALEELSNAMRKNDERTSEGWSKLSSFYSGVANELEDIEQHKGMPEVDKLLEEWKNATPGSVSQIVAKGTFKMAAAWNARGSGYANTVRPEQWAVFEKLLKESYLTLIDANKNKERFDPEALDKLITVGQATGMPRENADAIIEECIKYYPTYEDVYRSMAVYLLPRWQGQPGDILKFADDMRKRLPAPQGDIIYARIFGSVCNYIGVSEIFKETYFTYPPIKSAYETLIREYPDGMGNRIFFVKIAMMGDDLEFAKKLDKEIGEWTPEKIKNSWGNQRAYDDFRGWLDGKNENYMVATPLQIAIENDSFTDALKAVEAGVNVNRTMTGGSTPLISAISDKHADIADLLIEHGADLNAKTRSGYTVAAAAADGDNDKVLKLLFEKGFKLTDPVTRTDWKVIHMAAFRNAPKCMEFILKQPGVKVDTPLPSGLTPLSLAAEKNSIACARMLLDAGADINARDHHQITPLHHAALKGAAEMIQFLLEKGADPTAVSDCNISALQTAERNHQKEAIDLLKAAMAKKTAK